MDLLNLLLYLVIPLLYCCQGLGVFVEVNILLRQNK